MSIQQAMRLRWAARCGWVALLALAVHLGGRPAWGQAGPRVVQLASFADTAAVQYRYGAPQRVAEGPGGAAVARFEGRTSGGFTGRMDASFAARIPVDGVDLGAYDLLTLDVKADRAAFLMVAADNYPEPGQQARWYVLDALRGPQPWHTIYIDLDRPEEIKQQASGAAQGLSVRGYVKDTGRAEQGERRRLWIGDFHATRLVVDLDWDQAAFSQRRTSNGALVTTYPLTVTNVHDAPVTAAVRLGRVDGVAATAVVEPAQVRLPAGGTATVEARLTLPAEAATEPLYTERFLAVASAEGVPQSADIILRSSDPIHLVATVPLPEERLAFPLFPPPDALPPEVVHFDEAAARTVVARRAPADLIAEATEHGIYNYDERTNRRAFLQTTVAAAYLYRLTGERPYLDTAAELLAALPGIWAHHERLYEQQAMPLISQGVIVRHGDGFHYTLGLGWRLMGTQRSPYQYSYDHNAGNGSMSALLYAFDMVAADLDPALRKRIIDGFVVPAGIQARNHYIGDGNQQATADALALYAGLAGRNWPLVAFATSSEHSYRSILDWTFTDDGAHIRNKYQTYTLRPLFWILELLHARSLDVYTPYADRLEVMASQGFGDRYFWRFVQTHRLGADAR